jgi:hypothetical protein
MIHSGFNPEFFHQRQKPLDRSARFDPQTDTMSATTKIAAASGIQKRVGGDAEATFPSS